MIIIFVFWLLDNAYLYNFPSEIQGNQDLYFFLLDLIFKCLAWVLWLLIKETF